MEGYLSLVQLIIAIVFIIGLPVLAYNFFKEILLRWKLEDEGCPVTADVIKHENYKNDKNGFFIKKIS